MGIFTAWKVPKYRVISSPFLPVFGWIWRFNRVNLRIESKHRKIRTRMNSVFGHFSRSARQGQFIQRISVRTMLQEFQWYFKSSFSNYFRIFLENAIRRSYVFFSPNNWIKTCSWTLSIGVVEILDLIAFMKIFNFQEDRFPKTWDGANIMAPNY